MLADVLAAPVAANRRADMARRALAPLRISPKATRAALRMLDQSATRIPSHGAGPAGRRTASQAPLFRGWYLLNAARRIQQGLSEGKQAEDIVRRERTYLQAHHRAQVRRSQAAAMADTAATASKINTGRTVAVWRAVNDSRTTPDCRRMNGKTFDPRTGTSIGWPGSAHPWCRCWSEPVKPGRRYKPVPEIRDVEKVRRGR